QERGIFVLLSPFRRGRKNLLPFSREKGENEILKSLSPKVLMSYHPSFSILCNFTPWNSLPILDKRLPIP
ncbi:MAG: hypothetical protein ACKO7O_05940, partial [Bacteroidota bacterium]